MRETFLNALLLTDKEMRQGDSLGTTWTYRHASYVTLSETQRQQDPGRDLSLR